MGLFDFLRKKKCEPQKGTIYKYNGNVIAKYLRGSIIDYFLYDDKNNRPDVCPICHNKYKFVLNQNAEFSMNNRDLGETWDGYAFVSEKFYRFCQEEKYPNLILTPLERKKGVYYFEPTEIFQLDYYDEPIRTKFINKRDCCGSYDEVIKIPSVKSKDYKVTSNDFIMRSEYSFGSYERKSYLIIVGTETAKKMKKYGLRGIYFDDIYDNVGLEVIKEIVNYRVLE